MLSARRLHISQLKYRRLKIILKSLSKINSFPLFFLFSEIQSKESESSPPKPLTFDNGPFDSDDKQFQDYLKSSEKNGDTSEDESPDLEDLKEYIKKEQKTKYIFPDDDVTMMQGDDPIRYTNIYHDNTAEHSHNSYRGDRDKKGRGRSHRKNGRRRNKNRNRRPPPPSSANLVLEQHDSAGDESSHLNEIDQTDLNNYIYEMKPDSHDIKFRSCDELRCHAGGRCVKDEMRGGVRCQCQLGQTGEFCEQGKIPATLLSIVRNLITFSCLDFP